MGVSDRIFVEQARRAVRRLAILTIGLAAGAAQHVCRAEEPIYNCFDASKINDDREDRLQCYDRQAAKHFGVKAATDERITKPESSLDGAKPPVAPASSGSSTSSNATPTGDSLSDAWALGEDWTHKEWALTTIFPYRPTYVLVSNTDKMNFLPTSPAPGRTVTQMPLGYLNNELKFQLSFKTEFVSPGQFEKWFGTDQLRLWGAFTQQSNWQIFDAEDSRPFRESNYEPELILTYDTRSPSAFKMLNAGLFVHQSNGQANPQSRGWNRSYLQGGWDLGDNWSVLARGWYHLPESNSDNPDIEKYLGYGDVVVHWASKQNSVELLARNNMNFNTTREFYQLDWSHKFSDFGAKIHFQITSGFGDNLIDYNFRQRTVGIGLSADRW
jgi:phospholipase A1/A2